MALFGGFFADERSEKNVVCAIVSVNTAHELYG